MSVARNRSSFIDRYEKKTRRREPGHPPPGRDRAEGEKMKKIAWADVEHTEMPGSYPFLDGMVDIAERHIEIWKSNPTALFQVTTSQGLSDAPRYALGSWE
jgi:hypothetical protein